MELCRQLGLDYRDFRAAQAALLPYFQQQAWPSWILVGHHPDLAAKSFYIMANRRGLASRFVKLDPLAESSENGSSIFSPLDGLRSAVVQIPLTRSPLILAAIDRLWPEQTVAAVLVVPPGLRDDLTRRERFLRGVFEGKDHLREIIESKLWRPNKQGGRDRRPHSEETVLTTNRTNSLS